MKPYLIVASHGLFAQELLNSAEMIVGDLPEHKAISLTEEGGLQDLTEQFTATFSSLETGQAVIILADLMGGTPCNVATQFAMQRGNVEVISGLNLAMVIDYALAMETNLEILAKTLTNTGTEAVKRINISEILDDDLELED